MIKSEDYQNFYASVRNTKTVLLTTHVAPDGDGIGSLLALKHFLHQHFSHLSHVDGVISGTLPKVYQFLPNSHFIQDVETTSALLSTYDLAISLDCGSLERLGKTQSYFKNAKYTINIDHHISNTRFAELNLVDTDASATGQVLFNLFNFKKFPLNSDTATCLYITLLNDTGGFKYPNTNEKLFICAAELVRHGAAPSTLYHHLFESMPKVQVLLHAKALQTLQGNKEGTLYWTSVSFELLQELGAKEGHIEGLVERIRCIEGIKIAVLFREPTLGSTKVSLRSMTEAFNVAEVAKHFGGGGHTMAAGCTLSMPLEKAIEVVIPYLNFLLEKDTT